MAVEFLVARWAFPVSFMLQIGTVVPAGPDEHACSQRRLVRRSRYPARHRIGACKRYPHHSGFVPAENNGWKGTTRRGIEHRPALRRAEEMDLSQTGDVSLTLDTQIPILSVESSDERRVVALFEQLAEARGLAVYEWSSTLGLRRCPGHHAGPEAANLADPGALLHHVSTSKEPGLYVLCDLAPFLNRDPRLVRHLKDIAQAHDRLARKLVLVNVSFDVPAEIAPLTASFSLQFPADEELQAMIRAEARAWVRKKPGRRLRTDADSLDKLTASLRGATRDDAEALIHGSLFAEKTSSDDNGIAALNRLKFHLMDGDGVLRYEHNSESFANVAGLHVLRAWLELRRRSVAKAGRNRPKGLLLLGVEGSGKSLAARATAGLFGLPLLRLDFEVLYNRSIPRMERNLRNALRQAELMAPCVLWMDEIEHGFAARSRKPEVSEQMTRALLKWMAENTKPVFLVATSNNASEVPGELIEKGRLDEVFFLDLPDAATRQELFRLHLRQRNLDPKRFDHDALAEASEGFTGAEIESAIVVARYLAASRRCPPTTAEIVSALRRTCPMATLREEEVERLRGWARERTAAA